jgi:uncharacterized protein DUF4911
MNYCSYYQALVDKTFCWYVVAILKSYEHLAFDRTLDTQKNLFEFYVPPSREEEFLKLMSYFEAQHLVTNVQKLPNRLADSNQEL